MLSEKYFFVCLFAEITLDKENVNGTSHGGQLHSCQTYIKLSSLPSWPVYFTFSFSKVILANRQSKKYYSDNIKPATVFYDAKGKSDLEHARTHRACIEKYTPS